MVLKPLLETRAALDFCGGEAILPTSEFKDTASDSDVALHSALDIQHEISNASAFIQDPKKAVENIASGGSAFGVGGEVQDASVAELGNSATLARLTKTLSFGVGLLKLWAEDVPEPQIQKVTAAFEKCLELIKLIPRPPPAKEMEIEKRVTEVQTNFAQFLSKVTESVRTVEPGGVAVVPVGWLRKSPDSAPSLQRSASNRQALINREDDGHCVLLVVTRRPDIDTEMFALGVVNTGEGMEYHPLDAAGTAPNPGRRVRQSPLVLTGIPLAKLKNSTFWYLLYRQILYPSEANGPALLYETLLPSLNEMPLSGNLVRPEGWVINAEHPVTGDRAFSLCFERAVRFALVASGAPAEIGLWSKVALRHKLVGSIGKAIVRAQELSFSLTTADRAFLRLATTELARSAGEYACTHSDQRQEDLEQIQSCIQGVEKCVTAMDSTQTSAWSLLPPELKISERSALVSTTFANFDPLLRREVEEMKGGVDPPRILVPALTCMLPTSVNTPVDAAASLRLTAHLLTLLVNQQDQIAHSVPARFALVVHLVTRLLPMPLPLDHPNKETKCFWMQPMLYETKADLMKHIYLVSRHFAAVAFTVRANRESDGARVCCSAAFAAIMDALLRQPVQYLANADGIENRIQLVSSLISLHYSGRASGPSKAFGIGLGQFEKQSESFLLVCPEYASLRALLLDYFRSTSASLDKDHMILNFDRSMQCSDGDRKFVEQVGLSLGIGDAHREAHLLLTGKRPDLMELYPELAYFRDVVFMWKMLLLPIGSGPPQKNWRSNDSVLTWTHDDTKFRVNGFDMDMCAEMEDIEPDKTAEPGKKQRPWWLRMFISGDYTSAKKALSGASPSVLTGSQVDSEDDILYLDNLPTFNNTLGAADSELLLTYLTAPYIRVPLVLGFFTDRDRISLLREPQLQAVMDAALFEPGPWVSEEETRSTLPETIPADNRKHMQTPVGLLFNELLKSPKVVLNAIHSMLHTAVDKDNGQPNSANESLILYLVRLAVRVESYLLFIIKHIQQDGMLERSGANWSAKVRGLWDKEEGAYHIKEFQERHALLREVMTGDIYVMLQNWLKQSMQDKADLVSYACRAQAHLALLFKNLPYEAYGVREVASLLSANLYLNMNHRFASIYTSESERAQYSLGASEFELFDMFESKRSVIASWLREHPKEANEVFEKVEQVVTNMGTVDTLFPDQVARQTREWVELHDQPGSFVPKVEAPSANDMKPKQGEDFSAWLLRTTQGVSASTGMISVNLGMYKTKQEKIQLIPDWASQSPDYQEAFGRTNVQCSDREVSADRAWKDIIGHRHDIQRWSANAPIPEDSIEGREKYQVTRLNERQQWLSSIFEPVREAVSCLSKVEWYLISDIPTAENAEVWMSGVMETTETRAGVEYLRKQLKKVMVQRSPPVVEVYNVVEYGRQFYNTLIFSSDTMYSFSSPGKGSTSERLLEHKKPKDPAWTIASGEADEFTPPTPSVVTFRSLNTKLGRQMFVPPRVLRGLLPDCLLQQYKFWRSEDPNMPKSEGLLIGDERFTVDSPARIFVRLSLGRASWGHEPETLATIERKVLKDPKRDIYYEEWEVDEQKPPLMLVNMRKSLPTLARLLARLDNLSHILVWTSGSKNDGTFNVLDHVELPRLHLSFAGKDGHLHCEQHSGYWIQEKPSTGEISEILTHWGGGTVLLENSAGEQMVLTSAVAEPIIPAVEGAPVEYIEHFLPGQLMFRRGKEDWVKKLQHGASHHYYPVHTTGTFVFTPTWAAKLYLMLCRFAMWQFEDVAIGASTMSEITTAEERQLWEHVNSVQVGRHADAVACRLRLSIAAEPYGKQAAPPWDLKSELLTYIRKRHLVSVNCALNVEQELRLLKGLGADVTSKNEDFRVRLAFLQGMLHGSPNVPINVEADLGIKRDDSGFDRVEDRTIIDNPPGPVAGVKFGTQAHAYETNQRPSKPRAGLDAVQFLDSLFRNRTGGVSQENCTASWWLLYELFTGSLEVFILHGDEGPVLASFLLRIMGTDGAKGVEMSLLRIINLNPQVKEDLPKFGSQAGLVVAAVTKLGICHKEGTLRLTSGDYPATPGAKTSFSVVPAEILSSPRAWSGPLTYDLSCSLRTFANTGENFESCPLKNLAEGIVEESEQAGQNTSTTAVKNNLERLAPHFQSKCGKRTIERLLADLDIVLDQKTHKHIGLRKGADLTKLLTDLSDQKEKDIAIMHESISRIRQLANKGGVADWLCQKGGEQATIKFGMVVRALLANEEEVTRNLQRANSKLLNEDIGTLFDEAAVLLSRTVRIGQISRAQAAVARLQSSRKRSGGQDKELQIQLMEQSTARELNAARHFTNIAGDSSRIEYDPRLLVFEFLFNMLLRKSQVDLMSTFSKCIEKRQSMCHQMIMGAGKTTVVAPLLALLLADGERLVVACMPQELLAMSRAVLMEKFSAAVLPKPVLHLHFERFDVASEELFNKLDAARRRRAIVVSAPNSLKSLILKQVELLNQLDLARRYSSDTGGAAAYRPPPRRTMFSVFGSREVASQQKMMTDDEFMAKVHEVLTCNKIVGMFHQGSMLMDEVDLLLDPRKSELNWPLGAKVALDLTEGGSLARNQEGLRYKLPFHLLDAIFYTASGCPMTMDYTDRREALDTLKALKGVIEEGSKTQRLQLEPHLVVLSAEFYRTQMMPLLAKWAALFLEVHMAGKLDDKETQQMLADADFKKEEKYVEVKERLRDVSDAVVKLINLTHLWLHALLPHVLGKVHRVGYGLLTGDDYLKAERDTGTPRSRMFLALPFVGKDRPSSMSEFQHPDITIGFTILSYRYNGMRQDDMKLLWRLMISEMRLQNTVPYHRRDACKAYVFMVRNAGGLVRGFTQEGTWEQSLLEAQVEGLRRSLRKRTGTDSIEKKTSFSGTLNDVAELPERVQRMWPLEHIDVADPEQMKTLFGLLHKSGHAVRYFLEQGIFLPSRGVLDSNSNQLAASGQELAGPQLFGLCLGFSGTPNDLLPRSMGNCEYAKGDDGDILAALGNPDIVSVKQLDSWTPQGVLNIIAHERGDNGPKYHALIDTGALITGMNNYEVAEYLLKNGLAGIKGVIFLDANDERMVLVRNGMRVMSMAQCGLSPEERFTFYDHVHTTGMDIPQPLACNACVTLSKDMVFRDYAQGAYRMRGIGKGQCIEVFVIPEVNYLINHTLGHLEGGVQAREAREKEIMDLHNRDPAAWSKAIINDIIKWLIVNGIAGEDKRHLLLCQQSVKNIWRKAAAAHLETAPTIDPKVSVPAWIKKEETNVALNLLRNRIDTDIPNTFDAGDKRSIKKKLTSDFTGKMTAEASCLWSNEDKKAEYAEGFTICAELPDTDGVEEVGLGLEVAQVKEQEIEQETEQETEQQQEQQQELERDSQRVDEAAQANNYSREDEKCKPWPINVLKSGFGMLSNPPFYKISELQINMGIFKRAFSPLKGLPPYVLVSENYYRTSWRLSSTRRLKNIMCFLEWVPDDKKLSPLTVWNHLSSDQKADIKDAFQFWDTNKSGELKGSELRLLLKDIGLGKETDRILTKHPNMSLDADGLEREIATQSLYGLEDGRYYLIVTLEEAEHLRASMHVLHPADWPLSCGLALRSIGNLESVLHDSLIDSYGNVVTEQSYQLETAEQLLRFTNNSMSFSQEEVSILLRMLQDTQMEDRLTWWENLRACRRRNQGAWNQLPVASVFEKADEYKDVCTRAFLSNMRWAFHVLDMSPADAFRKLDTDQSQALSRQEILKGLNWIQKLIAPEDVWKRHLDAMYEWVDKDGSGAIGIEEFKAVMEVAEGEKYEKPNFDHFAEMPAAPERVDPYKPPPPPPPELLRKASRGRFKIKFHPWHHSAFDRIWDTRGTMSDKKLSIWAPTGVGELGGSDVGESVMLGHFVCTEWEAPEAGVYILTVKDMDRSGWGVFRNRSRDSINHFLRTFMPHPVRFRQAWTLRPPREAVDKQNLFIWQPVAPNEQFVALGCIATTTDEEPPLTSVRCVPIEWTEDATEDFAADKSPIWTDAGMGGQPASFWRRKSDHPMELFDVTTGQNASPPAKMRFMNDGHGEVGSGFYSDMPPWE